MRLRSTKSVLVGLVLGTAVSSAGLAGAAWVVESVKGEARGTLAGLSALKVSPLESEPVWPGQVMPLRVTIVSENPVPLDVRSVEVGDLETGSEECDASLKTDARLRLNRDFQTIKPGEQEALIATLRLSSRLADSCQRQQVKASVNIRAAYGS